jgi:hypothetical protein
MSASLHVSVQFDILSALKYSFSERGTNVMIYSFTSSTISFVVARITLSLRYS